MAKRKAQANTEKRAPGRPAGTVDPCSFRQSGTTLRVRISADDFDRYQKLAGAEGLSAVVRRLLERWAR